jgi:hypothetical protein
MTRSDRQPQRSQPFCLLSHPLDFLDGSTRTKIFSSKYGRCSPRSNERRKAGRRSCLEQPIYFFLPFFFDFLAFLMSPPRASLAARNISVRTRESPEAEAKSALLLTLRLRAGFRSYFKNRYRIKYLK